STSMQNRPSRRKGGVIANCQLRTCRTLRMQQNWLKFLSISLGEWTERDKRGLCEQLNTGPCAGRSLTISMDSQAKQVSPNKGAANECFRDDHRIDDADIGCSSHPHRQRTAGADHWQTAPL